VLDTADIVRDVMRRRLFSLICIFAFSTATSPCSQSQDQWDRYQPRTLKSIVDKHNLKELDSLKGVDPKKNAIFLTADEFPSQTKLVSTGEFRPLPAKKMVLLKEWRMMWKDRPLQAPPPDTYKTEVQFKEGTEEFWIAVQQPLLDNNPSELRKGEAINGYVVVIGAVRVGRRWEWLFAMNRFDS
jgi:hypothetical protein